MPETAIGPGVTEEDARAAVAAAREDRDEMREVANFYWNQERYLRGIQNGRPWHWTILRPVLIVGDSVGMVVQGHPNSLSVTLGEMIYHTKCVMRGARRALVVAVNKWDLVQDKAKAQREIEARLKESGVTVEGCVAMIQRQVALWLPDPKMSEYLQPSTLFGKEKFAACAACHGPTGQGNQAMGAPNLTDKTWLHGYGEEAITAMINNGKTNEMPAQKDRLTESQIHVLTAYVWGLSNK